MWFIFALISALFASVRKTSEKQLSQQLNHFTIGWTVQLLALPIITAALAAYGTIFNPLNLDWRFWIPTILIWFGFYPLNTFLYVGALKHGELSKTLPLQSFGPILALLLGWLFLRQTPTPVTAVGIAIVVLGIYILNLKGRYLHNPLSIFTNDKANRYTLFSLLLVAGASILDAVAIRASEPIYYSFVSTLGAVPVLYASARLFKVREAAETRRRIVPLSIAGSLFGASYVLFTLAISSGPLAYVSAVRSTSIIMGVAIGIIYLKEALTKQKVVAMVLVTAGSIIVALM
jgi:uncharacterized membrane protein